MSRGSFEDIAHREGETDYWYARELQELLGYTEWRNFSAVVERARQACANAGQLIEDHFVGVNKMVVLYPSPRRRIEDGSEAGKRTLSSCKPCQTCWTTSQRSDAAWMQYTLRNIPKSLNRLLRQQAKSQRKTLNEVVLEALQRAVGLAGDRPVRRDLSDIAGTWQDDPAGSDPCRAPAPRSGTVALRLAQGTSIPTNDLWIAAIVIEHGLALATRETRFAQIPQLVLAGER